MAADERKTPAGIDSERWTEVAEETGRLMRRSTELVREQTMLKKQRVSLFRDVVAAARQFVDEATRRR